MTQAKQEQNESCPACESDEIDDSLEAVEGICETCGFVLRERTNPVSLEWEPTEGAFRQPVNRDWLTECRVRNATEQQLAEAFESLEGIGDELGLSNDLREEAADIYCDAFRSGITDGRATACVVAACVRLASQRVGMPIPRGRLIEFPDVTETKFHQSHLALCDELDIDSHLPQPREYIAFLESQLGLTDDERTAVESFVQSIEDLQILVGKDPGGVAAAGVYIRQKESTQSEIAEAVGVSTETVRKRVKDIQEAIDDV